MISIRGPWYFSCVGSCSMSEILFEAKDTLVFVFIICSRICVFDQGEEEAIKSMIL